MKTITDMLNSEFQNINARFRTVSIVHLKELQDEISEWKSNGLISEEFFKQNYGEFVFHPHKILKNLRSIIIIGIPQKITYINFFYLGKKYQTVIPPTYIYSKIKANCKEILFKILDKKGYYIDYAKLPLKLLAVKSGLGKYGKNNICYIDGMGSFCRLQAFYSDYEFPIDDWHEKQIMKSCKTCNLCHNVCPTNCIPKERFLIHADHCLTYFNENKADFPSWVDTRSHNSLVGCMHCQIVCPKNKNFLKLYEQTIDFSEDEISMILKNTLYENISPTLAKKLADLNLDEYYSLLGRNLSVLINK